MPTTITAADPAHFLSLVPRLLGYTPARSLVLVPMRGSRSLGALRVDLPPDELDGAEAVAANVVGMVCRIPRADGMIAVIYTDASASLDLPGYALIAALDRHADACGLAVVDALTVAGDGWGSHRDPQRPEGGRPLAELERRLPPVPGDQRSGSDLPESSAQARADVAVALQSLYGALEVLCGIPAGDTARDGAAERSEDAAADIRIDPAALEAACAFGDLPALFEDALGWDAGDRTPMRIAELAWCLNRPALRDVALVQWSSDRAGGERAIEAQQRWEDGADYPADLASVMWGEGERPDPGRLETALTLVRHVAATAPTPLRAGPLAMCAWLAWALGRSTHAEHYAVLAHDVEPDHGLADIVRSFVAAAHLPDWAFRER